MTVIEYCREKTEVRELVVIRSGGYERCVAYVDCEDLFPYLPITPMLTSSISPATTSRFWTIKAHT